jgi:hypothetical protein
MVMVIYGMEWREKRGGEGMDATGREGERISKQIIPPFHLLLPYVYYSQVSNFFLQEKFKWLKNYLRYSFLWVFLSLSH